VFTTIILISSVAGVMQSCCYGLAGSLPGNYIASLNTGCALSGFIISIARAFSLLLFPTNDDPKDKNYFRGALLYFIIGAITLIIAIILVFSLPQTKYYIYYTKNSHILENEGSDGENEVLNTIDDQNASNLKETEAKKDDIEVGSFQHMVHVHNQLLITGYGVLIIYIQTFFVFPAVLLQAGIGFIDNKSWEVWFIISLFNFMDTISRYVSEHWTLLNEKTTALATL